MEQIGREHDNRSPRSIARRSAPDLQIATVVVNWVRQLNRRAQLAPRRISRTDIEVPAVAVALPVLGELEGLGTADIEVEGLIRSEKNRVYLGDEFARRRRRRSQPGDASRPDRATRDVAADRVDHRGRGRWKQSAGGVTFCRREKIGQYIAVHIRDRIKPRVELVAEAEAMLSPKDKIRKLLSLAQSPNPEEAASAAQMAQEMMDRHDITLDDVAGKAVEIADEAADAHRLELAKVIATARGCSMVSRRGVTAFGGRKDVARRAQRLYQALAEEADKRSRHYPNGSPWSIREAWRICFWIGFVQGVAEKLLPRDPMTAAPMPSGQAQAHTVPATIAEALTALEGLATCLGEVMSDIAGVLRRLRDKAHADGRMFGNLAAMSEVGRDAETEESPVRGLLPSDSRHT